jgi:hypothetical protein
VQPGADTLNMHRYGIRMLAKARGEPGLLDEPRLRVARRTFSATSRRTRSQVCRSDSRATTFSM